MSFPEQMRQELETFPRVLRELLEDELKAGNAIRELGHGFPAPPVGAYVKLAKPLMTRPRSSGNGIDYYDRNTSIYSGEITDAKRFFFLLEPPHPPQPEPDMNAIRAALDARRAAALVAQREQPPAKPERAKPQPKPQAPAKPSPPRTLTTLECFIGSMQMNYEKWHDGVGYDLDLIKKAMPQELAKIENYLVSRPVTDWRDVEALATLDTPRARVVLLKILNGRNAELATAVTDYAPDLVSDRKRTTTLVAALEKTEVYGGLTQALLQVEEFHPPKVIDALFRGVLARDGDTAVHFSAMLMFLFGKADSSFDWDQRPFFLKFQTEVPAERRAAFVELCEKLRVKPQKYLSHAAKAGQGRRGQKGRRPAA